MLTIRNLSFAIEGKPLFENATATIPTGHKVGIVGRNGTGKTSLFRIIKGEWMHDSGAIDYPPYFRVGGVDQEAPANDVSLLETVLAADAERAALMAEADNATDPARIADIHDRLTHIDAWSAEARATSILAGLGFDAAAQARPCSAFSGGWRMRVALAAVLFSQPDLLLLDEPTNYLDLEGAVWLEDFLSRYRHTVLVISHDRQLLNRAVTGILHLRDHGLAYYSGGYDQFDAERRMQLEQQHALARKQDAQRKHIQSFVDRFRYKASKARQAQSRLKQLAKMQPIMALSENAVAGFSFPTPEELPPPLLHLDRVTVGYNEKPVLRDIDLRLDADDRIALLGANGEGKSTLSKLIAGRLRPMAGTVNHGPKLRIGFFAQHQLDELVPGESPFQHIKRLRPKDTPLAVKTLLGGAGFGADIVDNPVECLSGGQKARLLMTIAAIDAPHILILDEPTNHLDIESRAALIQALNTYQGTVILVSHDSHLVEMVADQLWLVQDGRVSEFDGDMAEYQRQLLAGRTGPTIASSKNTPGAGQSAPRPMSSGREKRQVTSPLRAKINACERDMARLAREKAKIEAAMAAPGFYDGDNAEVMQATASKLAATIAALTAAESEWLAAEEALETVIATGERLA